MAVTIHQQKGKLMSIKSKKRGLTPTTKDADVLSQEVAASDKALITLLDHFYGEWETACREANKYGFQPELDVMHERVHGANMTYWATYGALPEHVKKTVVPEQEIRVFLEEVDHPGYGSAGKNRDIFLYETRQMFLYYIETEARTPSTSWDKLMKDLAKDGSVTLTLNHVTEKPRTFRLWMAKN